MFNASCDTNDCSGSLHGILAVLLSFLVSVSSLWISISTGGTIGYGIEISQTEQDNDSHVEKIFRAENVVHLLASSRLFKAWIALSSRYPANKVIHAKVSRITFIHWIKLSAL